jgi:hypothetical protein
MLYEAGFSGREFGLPHLGKESVGGKIPQKKKAQWKAEGSSRHDLYQLNQFQWHITQNSFQIVTYAPPIQNSVVFNS